MFTQHITTLLELRNFYLNYLTFRDAGIVTIGVGVGRANVDYSPSKILEIAGDQSRVFEVTGFSELDEITAELEDIIENAGKITSIYGDEVD